MASVARLLPSRSIHQVAIIVAAIAVAGAFQRQQELDQQGQAFAVASPDGHVADLVERTSPEARSWAFDYDAFGNLTSVTDPKGTSTTDPDDYTTTYSYDGLGRLVEETDANGNTTTYDDYHATGYPRTITDPLEEDTTFTYDARGNVTSVTDAAEATGTQEYDLFGRPGEATEPKDADNGELIVTPAPVYDPNDNITIATAPNGAETTASFDAADQLVAVDAPTDTPGGPDRTLTYDYDEVGRLTSETEPNGNLTADEDDFTTSYAYDEISQLVSVTNAEGDEVTYEYDEVGNVVTVVDPRKNASADPDDFTTSYAYDLNHQVTEVTDAEGNTTGYGYDRDGETVAVTDADGNTTQLELDERAMVTEVRVPHTTDGTGDVVYRTTRYRYDEVGNRTDVETPRGVATAEPDDFTHTVVYDELNRIKEQVFPYDPADPAFATPDKVIHTYDAVGRLAEVSAPPSDGQTGRTTTSYTYFDNGWIESSSDPWGITSGYDYNLLGQQTTRTVTAAGGSPSRTMGWDYYPDGKLKSRSDEGVPAGGHVVLVDNSDSQHVDTDGTWTSASSGDGFYGPDYHTAAAGSGTETFTWNLIVPADGTYEVFVRYPSGVAGAATDAPYEVVHDGGSDTTQVDQSGSGGQWVSLGSYAFVQGGGQQVVLSDDADGVVIADAVRLVRDASGETDSEQKTFDYSYDANGNLTEITDSSSGAQVDTYALGYTGLNQVASLEESAGGTVEKTTSFTYDANGNPATRTHDDQHAEYTYDPRDLLVEVSNGESPSDPDPKVTEFTYTARGQVETETKHNGNTVDYTYFLDGKLRRQTERKADSTLVSEHVVGYTLNGQRATDAVTTMSAEVGGGHLEHTLSYEYDPRERVAEVTKTAPGGSVLDTETYTHDANNNVVSQTVDGTTTTFSYDRDRLQSATSGGVTAAYSYDPFGRLHTVTAAGEVLEHYAYDGFDRIDEYQRLDDSGSTTTTTSYVYDPLDRTDGVGTADEKTRSLSYLGLSDEVIAEEVAGQLDTSYAYSAWGQRLSMIKHQSGGSDEVSYYGFNPHTDVEVLTDETGDTRATYGYTAYGKPDEDLFTGVDTPDPADPLAEPYNPYRFNNKRVDHISGNLDMGFRDYNPGLNRFLTRDHYNGALADLNLTVDPWTGNRYAFAAGNPITGVELDGHRVAGCDAVPDGQSCAETVSPSTFVGGGTPSGGRAYNAVEFGKDAAGVARGFAEGLFDTVVGLGHLAWAGAECLGDQLRCTAQAYQTGAYIATHPGETASALWEGLSRPIISDWQAGNQGEAIGRGIFIFAELAVGTKGLTKASKLSRASSAAPQTVPRSPDFVAGPPGSQPPVPVSQSRMATGFNEAGFPRTQTSSPGMEYILPDGSRVRLMAPSGQAPLRASFTNAQGGPINPFTGKPVQPPPPPGWSMKDWVRELTHIRQTP